MSHPNSDAVHAMVHACCHRLSHCHVFVLIWVSGLILFACIQTAWTLARGAGVLAVTLCVIGTCVITNLTDSIPTLYSTECAMNEYDDWTTTTHAVCAVPTDRIAQ